MLLFFVLCFLKKYFLALQLLIKSSEKKGLYTRREYTIPGQLKPNGLWSFAEVRMQQDDNLVVNYAKVKYCLKCMRISTL